MSFERNVSLKQFLKGFCIPEFSWKPAVDLCIQRSPTSEIYAGGGLEPVTIGLGEQEFE